MAPTTAQCRNDSPLRCAWRAALSERDPERLRYSYEASTWLLWLGDVPEAVSICPGCGGVLPQIGPVVAKLQAQGWVDTSTGEDGG
jgi:hypothetical protein